MAISEKKSLQIRQLLHFFVPQNPLNWSHCQFLPSDENWQNKESY